MGRSGRLCLGRTYLSHLSLLFLHGSQLIALRALLGGGCRVSEPVRSPSSSGGVGEWGLRSLFGRETGLSSAFDIVWRELADGGQEGGYEKAW